MFLDTTLLIDFLRGNQDAIKIIQDNEHQQLYTSEINVFELVDGVYFADHDIKEHLEKVLAMLTKINVLNFNRRAALKSGEISGKLAKKGIKIGEADCMIAGAALSNNINKIITRNKKYFSKIKELKIVTY